MQPGSQYRGHVVRLAKAHQLNIHPAALGRICAYLSAFDAAESSVQLEIFLRNVSCDKQRVVTAVEAETCIRGLTEAHSQTDGTSMSVIKAQDVPCQRIDPLRLTLLPAADAPRGRLDAMRQRLLFGLARIKRSDRHTHSLSALEGIPPDAVVTTVGLLIRSEDTYFLEDTQMRLPLVFSGASDSFITPWQVVLAVGRWNGHTFSADKLEQCPGESRAVTLSHVGHGLAQELKPATATSALIVASHTALDAPNTIPRIVSLVSGLEGQAASLVMKDITVVLCGNFTVCPTSQRDISALSDPREDTGGLFDRLADAIADNAPTVAAFAQIVLIPGPEDPCVSPAGVLPQGPLQPRLLHRFKRRCARAVAASNPCRLQAGDTECVIVRSNLQSMLSKNAVLPASPSLAPFEVLTETLVGSQHIIPGESRCSWGEDHCLRLSPLPSTLVVCDSTDSWSCRVHNARVFNPGSFGSEGRFAWYAPSDDTLDFNVLDT